MFPWESKALGYLPGFGDALPEKLQETGCTIGSLDREIFLSKTKRKFRLLFCRYQLAMQSVAFLSHHEREKSWKMTYFWKGHRWIVLTSAETLTIISWKSAVYLALHVHFTYLNICSVSPLRDKICMLGGDLTLEEVPRGHKMPHEKAHPCYQSFTTLVFFVIS